MDNKLKDKIFFELINTLGDQKKDISELFDYVIEFVANLSLSTDLSLEILLEKFSAYYNNSKEDEVSILFREIMTKHILKRRILP